MKKPPEHEPRCGQCKFWRKFDEAAGECYLNPPTIQMDEDGYQLLRPILEVDDYACVYFTGKQ